MQRPVTVSRDAPARASPQQRDASISHAMNIAWVSLQERPEERRDMVYMSASLTQPNNDRWSSWRFDGLLPGERDLRTIHLSTRTIDATRQPGRLPTFIFVSPSILKLCSASFAAVALASSAYSTNAMSLLVGMRRTSTRLGYLGKEKRTCR
jgi:hypothetical protein